MGYAAQTQALARGLEVLVATPGRLIDHIAERNITLAGTEVLVLDEADQMLDLGFLPPIRRIVSELVPKHQSLFFSATMPPEISRLANDLLRDPARIAAAPAATLVESVTHRVIHTESHQKRSLPVQLFADAQISRALVFTRTKRGADRIARHLESAGIRVAAIHGNKSQSQREHALAAFRAARVRVLVATDIAARGIDIEQVTHVVNYELPDVPEHYVHRIGRTARGGATGTAISLCDANEPRPVARHRAPDPAVDPRRGPPCGFALRVPCGSTDTLCRPQPGGREINELADLKFVTCHACRTSVVEWIAWSITRPSDSRNSHLVHVLPRHQTHLPMSGLTEN
jgi:ATP-dependent RNA helicase RhlE